MRTSATRSQRCETAHSRSQSRSRMGALVWTRLAERATRALVDAQATQPRSHAQKQSTGKVGRLTRAAGARPISPRRSGDGANDAAAGGATPPSARRAHARARGSRRDRRACRG